MKFTYSKNNNWIKSVLIAATLHHLVPYSSCNARYSEYNELTKTVAMDPIAPFHVEKLKWENDGQVIEQNFYRVGLPSTVRESLVSYAKRIGIYKLIDDIYFSDGKPRYLEEHSSEFLTLENNNNGGEENWFYERPKGRWKSDMHWISPADKIAHDSFLEALADGGFDKVLDGIGRSLGFDGISCYQLTFIVLQNCEKGFIHKDFRDTHEKGFNVIIPMNLVPGSEPELDILDENGEVGKFKYEYDSAIMLGDYGMHASARARNGKHVRIAATIYIADINKNNFDKMKYTQHYPPNDPKERLKSAGEHWKADGSTSLKRYLALAGRKVNLNNIDDEEEEEEEGEDYTTSGGNKFVLGLCFLFVFIGYKKVRTALTFRNLKEEESSLPDHDIVTKERGYIDNLFHRRQSTPQRRKAGHRP